MSFCPFFFALFALELSSLHLAPETLEPSKQAAPKKPRKRLLRTASPGMRPVASTKRGLEGAPNLLPLGFLVVFFRFNMP